MVNGTEHESEIEDLNVLRNVAEDLKTPLLRILTQLELNRLNPAGDTKDAEVVADAALRLLDSYILSTQSYTRQQELLLEPVAAQAIIYDCDQYLSKLARLHGVETSYDFQRSVGLVMANSRALAGAITSLAYSFLYNCEPGQKHSMTFTLRRSKHGVDIGLFSNEFNISTSSLQKLRQLKGVARQLSPDFAHGSSAGIIIADRLCTKMNVQLKTTRFKKMSGLTFSLVPSKQLSLV